jgi:uncharacterized protein YcbK (DUF882 family)
MGNLSKHFSDSEFSCGCGCGLKATDRTIIVLLELVRSHFNKPVIINSGARCVRHNAKIGGARRSWHLPASKEKGRLEKGYSKAVDFTVKGVPTKVVYRYLNKTFPNWFGLAGSNKFVHLDIRSKKSRWTY